MSKSHLMLCLLLSIILINVVGCSSPQPLPQPQISPFQSPVQNPTLSQSEVNTLIPKNNVQVGEVFSFDFDKDGIKEIAVAYAPTNAAVGGGLLVSKPNGSGYSTLWNAQIDADLKVTDFKARDMLQDHSFELLLFTQRQNTTKFPLYVYKWADGSFNLLKPNKGKLAGQSTFTSDYWPTTLGDVDGDGVMEIVPTLEFNPPVEYLEPNVYQWDGKNFTYTDFYIVPPRFKPEK